MQEEIKKQENCCTPIGQIKRYKDCIGCDRKPKQEIMYSEEEARAIWNAGQEYWRTSGASITFEELTDKFKNK